MASKEIEDYAETTIDAWPKANSSIIQLILAYDICGWRTSQIAQVLHMREARISLIKSSPLYRSQRERRWQELQEQVTGNNVSSILSGDPVEQKIKELSLRSIEVKQELLENGKPELRNVIATDLLDRGGYGAEKKKIKASIELSAKTAQRFERILRRQEPSTKLEIEMEQ